MPSPIMERAEKALLKIRASLTTMQSSLCQQQDTVAARVRDVYEGQRWLTHSKVGVDLFSMLVVGPRVSEANRPTVAKVLHACFTEPQQSGAQQQMERFSTHRSEITTMQQNLTTLLQSVDTALSRLTNHESQARGG